MYLKKKNWSVEEIVRQIHAIQYQIKNPSNDGYTAFELKKDLYQIKQILDDSIRSSPSFEGEEQWLQEQEKKRIIKILRE